jgi:hypothetical protein
VQRPSDVLQFLLTHIGDGDVASANWSDAPDLVRLPQATPYRLGH